MIKDRKIRKLIKKSLECPMPVDEFCEKAGIEFKPVNPAQTKRKYLIPIVSSTAAIVAVCGCIPLMLPEKSNTPLPPLYGYNDVAYSSCDISIIQSDEAVVMFNMEKVQYSGLSYFICPLSNANIRLGYSVENIVLGDEINETLYAYEFDYFIRTYKNFDFLDEKLYDNLPESFEYNGVEYKYEINKTVARITFGIDNNDYYIALQSYEDVAEIDRYSVEIFIKFAF